MQQPRSMRLPSEWGDQADCPSPNAVVGCGGCLVQSISAHGAGTMLRARGLSFLSASRATLALSLCLSMQTSMCCCASADDDIRRIPFGERPLYAESVIVTGRELVHTTQLFPVDQHGQLIASGDSKRQVQRVLDQVVDVLAAQQADHEDIVKLNAYVADEATAAEFFSTVQRRFRHALPAVSLVTTRLPVEGALIAVDAIAARPITITDGRPVKRHDSTVAGRNGMAHSAVLPVGETIYISGQAEQANNIAAATAATLAGLKRTLDHLGLGPEHVVQVKCFLQPMAAVGSAYHEIQAFFGDQLAPPTSVVEWVSSLPIEIEMVVHSPDVSPGDGLTHEWLPWLPKSPVYCRLTRVRSASQVFVSSCFGSIRHDETLQVDDAFQLLQERLEAAGSDLLHMAKATYYVRNQAASAAVNEIRPTLYDPEHPPAASKALVYGIGQTGCAVALDMIAVPANQ